MVTGAGACSCGLGFNNTGEVLRDARCQLLSCANTSLITRWEKTQCSRDTAEAVSILAQGGESRLERGFAALWKGWVVALLQSTFTCTCVRLFKN